MTLQTGPQLDHGLIFRIEHQGQIFGVLPMHQMRWRIQPVNERLSWCVLTLIQVQGQWLWSLSRGERSRMATIPHDNIDRVFESGLSHGVQFIREGA